MTAKTYEFEGQQRTASEVAEIVTALSVDRIREYLKRGMTTRTEMLCRPKAKLKPGVGWKKSNCRFYIRGSGR